ncbi:MAG TPA: phosphatase PAP2 family protein [Rhizomicrobium sp.]
MLLWAGLILIAIGAASLPFDRRAAHYFYDHESAGFERFLERTTHLAKAAHWLIAATIVFAAAQLELAYGRDIGWVREALTYATAFGVCLGIGSAILHGIKLVVGRRRPRDDFEMNLHGFVWFEFRLDYNSFPSGHALTIMCVAVIATCIWPQLALAWFTIALWLGLTRALLTAHYLSDVFIGAGIGLLAARETLLYLFPSLFLSWF